ncbi:hypothetical protein L7F22_005173 [Adiantum nelumboides]|nr:hypothetical protein [Adiantum nelumboides]
MPILAGLQAESFVVYIAFGSIATLSVEEIQELAMGLEACGSPFLWVIREDSATMEGLSQLLPKGFAERTHGKGMIISWAPQLKVLGHKAVGGFLSHCGWNSTVESLLPTLCGGEVELSLPLQCVGCRIGAGAHGDRWPRENLRGSWSESNEEGHKARSKAQEIMHLFERTNKEGGQSFTNLKKLYDDMRALCSQPSSCS